MKPLLLLLALFVSVDLTAAEMRIAVISKYELQELLLVKVLAKPENAQAKTAIQAANANVQAIQRDLGTKLNDPAQKDEVMKQLTAATQAKNDAEQQVKLQVEGELIKVLKEATQGRYLVVLDADMAKESIITKNAEMVDITLDIKEILLTK